MTTKPARILVRWPIGKRLDAGWVGDVPLVLEILSKHYAESVDKIRERLERGEQLKTDAYEYRMIPDGR